MQTTASFKDLTEYFEAMYYPTSALVFYQSKQKINTECYTEFVHLDSNGTPLSSQPLSVEQAQTLARMLVVKICVGNLPFVTEEFAEFFANADFDTETPSCSLAEALHKQDLFINASLSQMGASLLWNLFRNGLTNKRGFFLNLQDFRSQPILV